MGLPSRSDRDWAALFYEIRALGAIDEGWSQRLNGLRVRVDRDRRPHPVTTLTGELKDEAALNGVLTTLYSLGLTLLSVRSRRPLGR
ncbi:MAG: hypothetical protein IPF53_16105 [Blastocatellia bacterium]|nr:hypothetical protein [Blastocatellia bacterium]